MRELGKYLKVRRIALGLSQQSLAGRLGVAPSYWTLIERGERRPSLELTARIADTLSVERQELLFAAYPDAKELLRPANGTLPKKSSRSWLSFIKNRALLASYHVSEHELQVLAPSLSGISLSSKQFLAILLLMRNDPAVPTVQN
jgi:transcriptional regulator with XRE-family HTH domain